MSKLFHRFCVVVGNSFVDKGSDRISPRLLTVFLFVGLTALGELRGMYLSPQLINGIMVTYYLPDVVLGANISLIAALLGVEKVREIFAEKKPEISLGTTNNVNLGVTPTADCPPADGGPNIP